MVALFRDKEQDVLTRDFAVQQLEPPQDSGGDPVGYIDGNVYESVVDLRVICPDVDLVFRRAYGSWSMDAGTNDARGDSPALRSALLNRRIVPAAS